MALKGGKHESSLVPRYINRNFTAYSINRELHVTPAALIDTRTGNAFRWIGHLLFHDS